MKIAVSHVTKRFGAVAALDDVTFNVTPGELIALLGPSGCGKTTLLRIISGLECADGGSIHFDDEDASNRSLSARRVGFVFQHYALFRHMTVFENIAFGLRVRHADRPPEAEINRRVRELLALVKMDGLGVRYPTQLSGGQRQRVALARALAVEPQVLLLDEPFGSLDAKVREELRRWLRRLHDEIHMTSIFVTHDVEEALEVADRVVVMNKGRVAQIGKPDEVYQKPATPFVYRFLGKVNVFHARMEDGRISIGNEWDMSEETKPPLVAYARPHEMNVARERGAESDLGARIVRVNPIGPLVRIELQPQTYDAPIDVELSREEFASLNLTVGELVYVQPSQLRVFPGDYAI